MMKINFTQFFKKRLFCCCAEYFKSMQWSPIQPIKILSYFSTQLQFNQWVTSVHICKKTFPIAQVNHVFMALPRNTNGGVTSTLEATTFFFGEQFWSCFKKSSCVEVVFQYHLSRPKA
jgi:hypothetical protein